MLPSLSGLVLTGPPASKRPREDDDDGLRRVLFEDGFSQWVEHLGSEDTTHVHSGNLRYADAEYRFSVMDQIFRVTKSDTLVHVHGEETPLGVEMRTIDFDLKQFSTNVAGSSNGFVPIEKLGFGVYSSLDAPSDVELGVRFALSTEDAVDEVAAFKEMWLSLWAASHQIYPDIYAGSFNGGFPIHVTERGITFDFFLSDPSRKTEAIADAVGEQVAGLMNRCADLRLLMLDIKPGNLILFGDLPETVRAAKVIDLDTIWTTVLPDSASRDCVFIVNTTLLIRYIRCVFRENESAAIATAAMVSSLDDAVTRLGNYPNARLCDLLNGMNTIVVKRGVDMQRTYAGVASIILARARHYTNYDNYYKGRACFGVNGKRFDNQMPIWPQLVEHAKHVDENALWAMMDQAS